MTTANSAIKDNSKGTLTIAKVMRSYFISNKAMLMAINLADFEPRILTGTDDKRYVVLYSSFKEVRMEETRTSLVAMPALSLFKELVGIKEKLNLDGMIINPWGQRLTITWQQVRDCYFQYIVQQYTEDKWWQSPLHTVDYDALMWNNGEPYDEIWLAEMIEEQNRKVVNVAWWAQEQPQVYKKPPLFMQIWLAFYGLFWLQTIFTAGLNTLYYKEIDEASVIQSVILSIGVFLIFKYLNRFTEWWDAREARKQELAEQAAWEAAAPEREAQAKFEEEVRKKALELIAKREEEEQQALQAIANDHKA